MKPSTAKNQTRQTALSHVLGNSISLYRAGIAAAIAMFVIMIAQILVFVLFPPPETVEGFFALFQQSWLKGLLSLDLLYLVNNALLILIYLALYAALKRANESVSLIALTLGLVGIAAYYASGIAFEMLTLSRLYAAADEAGRQLLLGSGQVLMATYTGTAFDAYYILNAASLLLFAAVMLRSEDFPRSTAVWGLAAGVLMLIPSSAGTLGMIFSLASLVPWAVFLALLLKKFLQFSRAQ